MTIEPTPEQMAKIDKAADAIDRFMDSLDEIANPELFKELKNARLELATREAEPSEANKIIEARQGEIHDLQARLGHALQDVTRSKSELESARNYADDVAADLGKAKEDIARFEAAWSQAMTELGDLKRRHDQFLRVFDGMVDLGAALGRINSELDQMRLAMFKALDAALGPDPASPNPVVMATARPTASSEVDERDPSTGDGEAAGELS